MNKIVASQEFGLIVIGGCVMNVVWAFVLGWRAWVIVFLLVLAVAIGHYVETRREGRHW